jgi:hypothetical protein
LSSDNVMMEDISNRMSGMHITDVGEMVEDN